MILDEIVLPVRPKKVRADILKTDGVMMNCSPLTDRSSSKKRSTQGQIDSRAKEICPASSLVTDALDYRTYLLVNRSKTYNERIEQQIFKM